MSEVVCALHKKPMRYNARYGWSCPTPLKKSQDGKTVIEWCCWKPGEDGLGRSVPAESVRDDIPFPTEESVPSKQSFNGVPLEETDGPNWVEIGRVKALCGMVNARLQNHTPADILPEVPHLRRLLRHLEAEAHKE